MKAILILAALGVGAYLWLGDPRGWPQALAEQRERLPEQIREAVEAGKRAAARREEQVQAELAAALEGQG
ncbi:MAG: hypothetical protein QOD86_2243 [Miltoncostaeaceae bacterium]|nr:hypothetical protein [Miltoncostaeaceae bacterium]